eukprot:gene5218-8820_t
MQNYMDAVDYYLPCHTGHYAITLTYAADRAWLSVHDAIAQHITAVMMQSTVADCRFVQLPIACCRLQVAVAYCRQCGCWSDV